MALSKARAKARDAALADILAFIKRTDRLTVSLEEFTGGRGPTRLSERSACPYPGPMHSKEAVSRAIKQLQTDGVLGKGGFPAPIPRDIAYVKEFPVLARLDEGARVMLVRDYPSQSIF